MLTACKVEGCETELEIELDEGWLECTGEHRYRIKSPGGLFDARFSRQEVRGSGANVFIYTFEE